MRELPVRALRLCRTEAKRFAAKFGAFLQRTWTGKTIAAPNARIHGRAVNPEFCQGARRARLARHDLAEDAMAATSAAPLERYVVIEELLAAGAPVCAHWVADRQSGPLLLRFGTEEQRAALLPGDRARRNAISASA